MKLIILATFVFTLSGYSFAKGKLIEGSKSFVTKDGQACSMIEGRHAYLGISKDGNCNTNLRQLKKLDGNPFASTMIFSNRVFALTIYEYLYAYSEKLDDWILVSTDIEKMYRDDNHLYLVRDDCDYNVFYSDFLDVMNYKTNKYGKHRSVSKFTNVRIEDVRELVQDAEGNIILRDGKKVQKILNVDIPSGRR